MSMPTGRAWLSGQRQGAEGPKGALLMYQFAMEMSDKTDEWRKEEV